MPVLSRFYGIVIKMYFLQGEHNPPHIHAIYNDDVAAIDYMNGEVLEGYLPPKALKMVREWIEINRSELQIIWETQEFKNFHRWNRRRAQCFIKLRMLMLCQITG